MSISKNGGQTDEASLLKLFMNITGSTESEARSVFMYVSSENGQQADADVVGTGSVMACQPAWDWEPRVNSLPRVRWPRRAEMSALGLRAPARSFA